MRVAVWKGDAASERLHSPELRGEWERLYAECPWASVFQSYGYVSIWYDVYRARFTPLLLTATDDGGRLCGLFPLALDSDGTPVAAGARQAEYQVWIARPGAGDAFIASALERLAVECPGRTLYLRYLPPNTPRAWLTNWRRLARPCEVRALRRGIIDLTEADVEAALRKKSSRRKLNTLERVGPVTYEAVTDPESIDALIEEIAPMCDLRMAALHDVLPFRSDPLKLPFHRALARLPGMLHVSVLRCGGEIASVQVDADNRGQVALGFSALSPSLGRHSPGRLHMLFLARDLARDGHRSIDLTPGDAYKNLLATRFDEVYTLRVTLGARPLPVWRAANGARRAAKSMIARARIDPARLRAQVREWRQAVAGAGPGRAPERVVRALRTRLWSNHELELHELPAGAIADFASADEMRVDCLPHLVSYRQGVTGFATREQFLRRALALLERGSHAYTRADGSDLVGSVWMSPPEVAFGEDDIGAALPTDSVVAHDFLARRDLCRADEWMKVISRLARDAVRSGVTRLLVAVPSDRADLREAAGRVGARHVGSVFTRTRGSATRRWTTVRSPARLEPAREIGTAGVVV